MDKLKKCEENGQSRSINTNFDEIFYQSPTGILLYDKKGRLTNANDSALKIARIPKLDDVLDANLFDNPSLASRKEELHEKGLIKFQDSLNLIKIKEQNIYNPVEPKIIDIDWTVSVTDSGYLIQIQDITEQMKVEKEKKSLLDNVQAERDMLSALINNIPDEVWFADKNKKFTLANPSALREFGLYSKDIDIEKLASNLDVYRPDGSPRPVNEAPPLRALNGEQIKNMEEIVRIPPNKELRYRQVNASPVKDNNGNIIGAVSVVRDVTDSKKAEEKTKMVLDSIVERYAEFDNEWHYVDVNSQIEEIYDMNRNEIIGKTLWDVFPQLLGSKQCKMFSKAKKENVLVRFEAKSLVTGEWFETNAYPHPDGLSVYSHNINERKKAEEALKESKEKYNNLFERMNEGFTIAEMIYDNDGEPFDFRWIDMNHAYEQIIGFNRDKLLKTTARSVFPKLKAKLVENFGNVMLTGKQLQFENYNIELNKWFDVIAYKITQKHFAYLTLDITERKQTENERNQLISEVISKEEELSALIENIVDEVWFCDVKGNIILANAAARRFEKESNLENLNSVDKMISHVEVFNADGSLRSREDSPLIRALNDEIVDLEDIVVFPNTGKKIYRQITAAPIKDNKNKITGAVAVIRDITESKKIQEKFVLQSKALKKSENSLANAQHIAHIGSWEWNIKTGDIIWSNELYSIYGLDPNTFIPTLSSFGDYMHPDDEEYVNQHVDQILSENKPHNFDFRIILDDGSIRVLNTLAEVTKFDKNGEPEIIIGINQDITERKEIELKLNENIQKLAQSNKELEQFAYITSHDLREPLRMITSFLQLLEKRYKDQLDQDANEFIGFAVNGAKRLDTMTKDLLKYSQITHKKGVIKPVNFEHVLEHALTNLKVQIEENNAIITHDLLPTINGNEELKIQLFQNIIGNAIKYRSQKTPKIHISAIKEKNHHIFSIKDNGIGMSSKHMEKIFIIFQRLHTHDEYEGTGIGLAIAQKIVHQQGGQIWVESELGKGSTFYFTIPIN